VPSGVVVTASDSPLASRWTPTTSQMLFSLASDDSSRWISPALVAVSVRLPSGQTTTRASSPAAASVSSTSRARSPSTSVTAATRKVSLDGRSMRPRPTASSSTSRPTAMASVRSAPGRSGSVIMVATEADMKQMMELRAETPRKLMTCARARESSRYRPQPNSSPNGVCAQASSTTARTAAKPATSPSAPRRRASQRASRIMTSRSRVMATV